MADKATVLTGGTNSFQTTAEHVNYPATDFISQGVVGTLTNTSGVAPATGGLAVNAQGTPNMTVAVTAGVAYVTATPTGQASQRIRANIAAQNVTIASNATGGTRFEWIYVTISAANANTPNVAGDNVASITQSRSTSASTDNGTPPTYGYAIAVVTVTNGASSITNGNIADSRTQTGPNNLDRATSNIIQANQLATSSIKLGRTAVTTGVTATATTAATGASVASLTVTIPAGGRDLKLVFYTPALGNSSASSLTTLTLWDSSIGGTQLQNAQTVNVAADNTVGNAIQLVAYVSAPAAGSKTYVVGLHVNANTGKANAGSTNPIYLSAELI